MESITNIDFKKIPQVFFQEERYNGEMVFINGYNGYTKAKGDSMLCAVINKSAFDSSGRLNYLTDKFGNQIHSENRRGQFVS